MLEDKVLDSAGNLADSTDMTTTPYLRKCLCPDFTLTAGHCAVCGNGVAWDASVSPAAQCAQANDQLLAAINAGDREATLDALQIRLDLRDRYPDVSLTDVVCARFLLCREAHLEGRLTCHG